MLFERKKKTMRVGIVGSREYTNSRKVKDFIARLRAEFGDDLEIVSGEQALGADGYAKKFAKELGVKYVAFPPLHYRWVPECPEPAYMYNKEYKPQYFFLRNIQIAEYSDVIAAFIPRGVESKGTMHTIKEAQKRGKPTQIIN